MTGPRTNKDKLNHTLETVCNILHENKISDWFVFFGTLLGLTRDNSCIQGDDDLDIMIKYDYQELRSLFSKQGFKFQKLNKNNQTHRREDINSLLKIQSCNKYASFDFYICDVNESGDFHTPWHGVTSTESYLDLKAKTFVNKKWRSTVVQLPNNYESKVVNMYGPNWRTPQSRSCKRHMGEV